MGADDDVDLALGQAVADGSGFFGRDEAGKLGDLDRQAGETLAEDVVVLTCEQRGRRQDRHLLAGHRHHEGGAQGHFRLAEADIAAHQPVHRLAGREIRQHLLDRPFLVLGLLKDEARRELVIKTDRRLDRLALHGGAPGRDLDQLAGDLLDALLDARLALLPAEAAELVELHDAVARAVAGQHIQILDRHEQAVPAVIDQPEAVMGSALELERDQPVELADTVIAMHHEIALGERCDLGNELVRAPFLLDRAGQAIAENVRLGKDGIIGGREAAIERQHGERRPLLGLQFLP